MINIFKKLYSKFPFIERSLRIKERLFVRDLLSEISGGFSRRSNLKVVIINHFFDLDKNSLINAAKGMADIDISVISKRTLPQWARYYLPESAAEIKGYYNEDLKNKQSDYRRALSKHLQKVKKKYGKLVFISPSDQFFWIREFVHACSENKIPFVVLDKEGFISPLWYIKHAQEIKKYLYPISDFYLVWSQRQKDFYISAGADPGKIHIVGQPRSDFWFHKQMWSQRDEFLKELNIDPSKKYVLYFDFERNNYIYPEDFAKDFSWDALLEDIHSSLLDLAKKHPEINFVYKLHPQSQNSDVIQKRIEGVKNIRLFIGATISNDLIIHSSLVIVPHSTVALDSMLAGKPVIYPFWGNANDYKENLVPFQENKGIDVARSKDEFAKKVKSYINNGFNYKIDTQTIKERNKLIEVFCYNPDGNVGKRTLEKIKALFKEYDHE